MQYILPWNVLHFFHSDVYQRQHLSGVLVRILNSSVIDMCSIPNRVKPRTLWHKGATAMTDCLEISKMCPSVSRIKCPSEQHFMQWGCTIKYNLPWYSRHHHHISTSKSNLFWQWYSWKIVYMDINNDRVALNTNQSIICQFYFHS